MSDVDAIAVGHLPCPYCGAAPGEVCTVSRGRTVGTRATWTHTARTDAVRAAWLLGHRQGQDTAREAAAWALQSALDGSWWARKVPTDLRGVIDWLRAGASA